MSMTHLAHVTDDDRTICCVDRDAVPEDTILTTEEADEDHMPDDLCQDCLWTMHVLSHIFDAMQAKGVAPEALTPAEMTRTIAAANAFARKEPPDAAAH